MARTYYLGGLIALVVTTVALVAASLVISVRPAEAAFPGENGKIVFASSRTTGEGVDNPKGDSEIFTINPDGTGLAQITKNDYNDIDPVFSPNGSQIAFSNDKDGTGDHCAPQRCPTTLTHDIYKMNADGSNPTRLTKDPDYDFAPAWSPDGTEIAFESYRDGNIEIFEMNADSPEVQTNLTKDPADDTDPAWSPDGTEIAFDSKYRQDAYYNYTQVYKMNADNPEVQTNLTRTQANDTDPSWSPNGTEIAFVGYRNGYYADIYKMKASDGADQTNLTRTQANDTDPSWSPDGTEIAFVGGGIRKMDATDGSNPTCLTDRGASPDWGMVAPDPITDPPEQPVCTEPPSETNTAPTISGTRPTSKTRDVTPTIRATITDAEGQLDKGDIRLFVDSKEVSDFSYDPSTGKLSYVSRKLKPGRHRITIEAVDPQGLSASETWTFKVNR